VVSEGVAGVGLDGAHPSPALSLPAAGSMRLESFTVEPKPEAWHPWMAQRRARFPQGKIARTLKRPRGHSRRRFA